MKQDPIASLHRNFEGAKIACGVLDQAHRMRNVAEYDGELDATEALVASMIGIAQEMVRGCEALGKA